MIQYSHTGIRNLHLFLTFTSIANNWVYAINFIFSIYIFCMFYSFNSNLQFIKHGPILLCPDDVNGSETYIAILFPSSLYWNECAFTSIFSVHPFKFGIFSSFNYMDLFSCFPDNTRDSEIHVPSSAIWRGIYLPVIVELLFAATAKAKLQISICWNAHFIFKSVLKQSCSNWSLKIPLIQGSWTKRSGFSLGFSLQSNSCPRIIYLSQSANMHWQPLYYLIPQLNISYWGH